MSDTATEAKQPDLEVIVPDEVTVMVGGKPCRVKRLKTIEFLALLRVLTRGLGPSLQSIKLSFDDEEKLTQDLTALMVLAVPEAADEFVAFLLKVIEPVNKQDRGAVDVALGNPDPEVLIDVFEAIAVQERDDLKGLAGKAQAMWSKVQGLYQAPKDG